MRTPLLLLCICLTTFSSTIQVVVESFPLPSAAAKPRRRRLLFASCSPSSSSSLSYSGQSWNSRGCRCRCRALQSRGLCAAASSDSGRVFLVGDDPNDNDDDEEGDSISAPGVAERRHVHGSCCSDDDGMVAPQSSACLKGPRGGGGAATTSRRAALLRMALASSVGVGLLPSPANAGRPEIDAKSGELFTPKAQMLGGGGSDAARGIKMQSRDRSTTQTSQGRGSKRSFAKTGTIQTVYSARFIAYLSRFILNFDPAARSWWLDQERGGSVPASSKPSAPVDAEAERQLRFAEFAESVEVGLADYFVGPYGSYASIQAAKAGLSAAAPATSGGVEDADSNPFPDFSKIIVGLGRTKQQGTTTTTTTTKKKTSSVIVDRNAQKRQGILNLLTLLKTRYTSLGAKSQLAILFALIDDPELQPTAEIKGLLGEVDNASLDGLELEGLAKRAGGGGDISDFRRSSRRGGGYSLDAPPTVEVEPPPALGGEYRRATLRPVMEHTSRVLRINVLDGGGGYKSPPSVTVSQGGGVRRTCDAAAILDRGGRVESVIVLDPGWGYGGGSKGRRGTVVRPPTVEISPPPTKSGGKRGGDDDDDTSRQAQAVAELEYAIRGVEIVDPGSGYVVTQPPKISIPPCDEDPEWFVSVMTYAEQQKNREIDNKFVTARVTSMKKGFYNTTVDTSTAAAIQSEIEEVDSTVLDRLKEDALSVLPSTIRPRLEGGVYRVPSLPPTPEQPVALPSQRYRAIDPYFGGVGTKPVTIGAKELSVSEYSRLALSGAVCTVLVRTLLNPLELVKTKIQLKNDEELMRFAAAELSVDEPKLGTSKRIEEVKDSSLNGKRPDMEMEALPRAKQTSKAAMVAIEERKATTTELKTEALHATASNADTLETVEGEEEESKIGTFDLISALIKLRGPWSLFQSADITFLASLVFGSFGFGATELFRRSFTTVFFDADSGTGGGAGSEFVLLGAAALACILTSAAATPFEMIRVQSMGKVEPQGWTLVLADFLAEKRQERGERESKEVPQPVFSGETFASSEEDVAFNLRSISKEDIKPLFSGFAPIVSRELPFAVIKFLVFDLLARAFMGLINSQPGIIEPVQVGVGPAGLAVSALAGALAGIAGAIISHPADLILTLISASKKKGDSNSPADDDDEADTDWRQIIQELLAKEGGIANLFVGLPARAAFFFLVIGLQFFLYDYVKGLFQVSPDDLTLVLDVFYAIRQGL